MPPRLPRQALQCACLNARPRHLPSTSVLRSISTTSTQLAEAQPLQIAGLSLPADYVPPTQPPSARRPENRQSQLIRTYTSLLRSTPLMLFFQHNNLTAVEWTAVRRELKAALAKVPPMVGPDGKAIDLHSHVQIQVLKVRMFHVALKITELFDPQAAASQQTTPRTRTHGPLVHDLSSVAYESLKGVRAPEGSVYGELAPLLTGPIAALVFPAVMPAHLAAALSVLAPSPPEFPAPTRRKSPGYHEPIVQNALSKIFLVGGRVDGKVFDSEGLKWVGSIEGGLDGLRARLVSILQSAGLGVTSTLESAGRSLWVSLESRKMAMEEEEQGGPKAEEPADKADKADKTDKAA